MNVQNSDGNRYSDPGECITEKVRLEGTPKVG